MKTDLLLERHFAGTLSANDQAEMEAHVRAQPENARAWAQAARLEMALASHFATSPSCQGKQICAAVFAKSRPRPAAWLHKHGRAAAVFLALAMAAAGVVWWGGLAGRSQRQTAPAQPRMVILSPPRVATPELAEPAETIAESKRATRLAEQYYLSELDLDQPVPIADAIGVLLSRAKELNHFQRPEIARLRFVMPSDEALAARMRTMAFHLPFKNAPLKSALEWYLASVYCDAAFLEDGSVVAAPWESHPASGIWPEDGAVAYQEIRVPLDWMRIGRSSNGEVKPPRGDVTATLRSWGCLSRAGNTVLFDQPRSLLTGSLSLGETLVLRKKMQMIILLSQEWVTMTWKVFELPERWVSENRLLDDKQFQEWLKEQNTRGADLFTAPQVISPMDQRSKAEVIKMLEEPEEEDWQGLVIDQTPQQEGELIKLAGSVELRRPPWAKPGEITTTQPVRSADLISQAADFDLYIPRGETAIFAISDAPEGPHVVAAVTVGIVTPSGKSVESALPPPSR